MANEGRRPTNVIQRGDSPSLAIYINHFYFVSKVSMKSKRFAQGSMAKGRFAQGNKRKGAAKMTGVFRQAMKQGVYVARGLAHGVGSTKTLAKATSVASEKQKTTWNSIMDALVSPKEKGAKPKEILTLTAGPSRIVTVDAVAKTKPKPKDAPKKQQLAKAVETVGVIQGAVNRFTRLGKEVKAANQVIIGAVVDAAQAGVNQVNDGVIVLSNAAATIVNVVDKLSDNPAAVQLASHGLKYLMTPSEGRRQYDQFQIGN